MTSEHPEGNAPVTQAQLEAAAAAKKKANRAKQRASKRATSGSKASTRVRVRMLVPGGHHKIGDVVSVDTATADRLESNRLATRL